MRKIVPVGAGLLAITAVACFQLNISARAQGNSGDSQKTAAQQYKNIQVLKDIPADQLIPTMQFITASLNVECEFCHVEHQMDKDDKKEKKTARKMMAMELAIDKDNFDGNLVVTCYTCHRGSAHPVGIPILTTEAKPAPHVHEHAEGEAHANLPPANQILDKYLAAVGGADALKKIKSRVEKGTIDAMGQKYPIEVYSEAPDKRVSISRPQGGASVTGFNGQAGWLSMGNRVHLMSPSERQGAQIDAEFYLPVTLRDLYKQFRVLPSEDLNGHPAYVVSATGGDGHPALKLYFDPQSGLLKRLIRYTETALGRNPTEIDYADYRDTNGVKIPYEWTLVRPNGSFTIRVTDVKQNVPIDQKLFTAPAENQSK
jgi:photosynthetic reaction center cytochrome c subunit